MSRRSITPRHIESLDYFMPVGREHERRLFGAIDTDNLDYRRALDKVTRPGHDNKKYVNYGDALNLARGFQPGDPTNPSADFLRELRLAVLEKLDIEDEGQAELISAYTAVGTPLDILHGVDGFIIVSHEGYDIPITFDATLRREKLEERGAQKADILIGDVPEANENESKYLAQIDKVAGEIVRKIYMKIEEHARAAEAGLHHGRLRKSPPPEAAAMAQNG